LWPSHIDPLITAGVVVATALTDATYVMFTASVVARKRVPAATWSSVWYLLSSFALGSWIGAYLTLTVVHRAPSLPPAPPGAAPG
jgi:hypothetical protein